jgi:hypothetical protein
MKNPPPVPDAKGPFPFSALAVAVATTAVHLGLDLAYRPWAWTNQVVDLGLADSFTNLTSVVGLSAVMVMVERKKLWEDTLAETRVVGAPVVGMIGYELIQSVMPTQTFDVADIGWTLAGGAAAWVIKRGVYDRRMKARSTGQ